MTLPNYEWLGQDLLFQETLALQELRVKELAVHRTHAGSYYFLEHTPVYTIGLRRKDAELPALLPHPVAQINRGGLATYHGPGQLVGYLLTDLTALGKDLHAFLRMVEESLINACLELNIPAQREEGLTGVWVNGRKVASIGVGVRKWISMHGFAMNITPESLPPFAHINPCGIDGVVMSCLHHEGSWKGSPQEFSALVYSHMIQLMEADSKNDKDVL